MSVDNPSYYKIPGRRECIEEINESFNENANYILAFCLGNAHKYLYRLEKKGTVADNLVKVAWYLNYAKCVIAESDPYIDSILGDYFARLYSQYEEERRRLDYDR